MGNQTTEYAVKDSRRLFKLSGLVEEYHVVFHSSMEMFVDAMIKESKTISPNRTFIKYTTKWDMFDDDTDNIRIEGMNSPEHFQGKNVIFVASFTDNSVTMSQFHVITFLCECLVATMTVLLPYYSTGTMERVDIGDDGAIPTANP